MFEPTASGIEPTPFTTRDPNNCQTRLSLNPWPLECNALRNPFPIPDRSTTTETRCADKMVGGHRTSRPVRRARSPVHPLRRRQLPAVLDRRLRPGRGFEP